MINNTLLFTTKIFKKLKLKLQGYKATKLQSYGAVKLQNCEGVRF